MYILAVVYGYKRTYPITPKGVMLNSVIGLVRLKPYYTAKMYIQPV